MYGLSHDNPDLHFTGIDYALYTERAEGRVYVYENGTNRGQVGTWTSGDRFRVAVEGGVVKYKKNNTVLYTSQVSPTYPLFVDTSLYNGNTLSNVVISGDFTGAGLRYVLQDIQGTARAVMKSDGTVAARHDYLPFGEEIGALGSRATTPGYGGADANRWDYGLTERDQKSGLDHTWFRKYENKSGRMTSPDPLVGNIGDPQSFNRYGYVRNDPVNFVDPTGLYLEFRHCHADWRWIPADVRGGGYWQNEGQICDVVWVDDGPYLGIDGDGLTQSQQSSKTNLGIEKPCATRGKDVRRDLRAIARMLHGTLIGAQTGQRFPGGQIDPRGQSYDSAVNTLRKNGFENNLAFDHPEGAGFQKKFSDGLWYHVIVNYPKDPKLEYDPSTGSLHSPAATPQVTAHCHSTHPEGWDHIKETVFGP